MSKAEFLADIQSARVEFADVLARRDEKTLSETVVPGLSWTTKELLAHSSGTTLRC